MTKKAKFSGYYTTAQAAFLLDISSHEVARLFREGQLNALRSAGNTLLVDAVDVQQLADVRQGKGRPLLPSIAWASLWMLSGLEVNWLSYQQLRRLKVRLAKVSAHELIWQARNRSTTHRYRASESFLDKLKSELVLTGKSSNLVSFNLTIQNQIVEGYAFCDFETLEKKFHLIEDAGGNATIHKPLGNIMPVDHMDAAPVAVAAIDLSLSLDSRERNAGLQILEGLLDERRSN